MGFRESMVQHFGFGVFRVHVLKRRIIWLWLALRNSQGDEVLCYVLAKNVF